MLCPCNFSADSFKLRSYKDCVFGCYHDGKQCRHNNILSEGHSYRSDFTPLYPPKATDTKQNLQKYLDRIGVSYENITNKTGLLQKAEEWWNTNKVSLYSDIFGDEIIPTNNQIDHVDINIIEKNLLIRFNNNQETLNRKVEEHLQLFLEETDTDEVQITTEVKSLVKRDLLGILLFAEIYITDETKLKDNAVCQDKFLIVFCILHMLLRIGSKLIRLLITDLYSLTLSDDKNTDDQIKKERLMLLQNFISEKILSKTSGETAENVRLEVEKNVSKHLSFGGKDIRKILKEFEALLNVAFPLNERIGIILVKYNNWHKLLSLFNVILETLNLDIVENPIAFQKDTVDKFGNLYLDMFPYKDVTCYVEILLSGHISQQLLRCNGNIKKFSQQSFEKMNDVLKTAFRHTSNKGASAGIIREEGQKSTLIYPAIQFFGSYCGRQLLYKLDEDPLTKEVFEKNGWLYNLIYSEKYKNASSLKLAKKTDSFVPQPDFVKKFAETLVDDEELAESEYEASKTTTLEEWIFQHLNDNTMHNLYVDLTNEGGEHHPTISSSSSSSSSGSNSNSNDSSSSSSNI